MFKKQILGTFIIALTFLLTGCDNENKKAEEYIQNGNYQAAYGLAKKRLESKPIDHKAYFLAGKAALYLPGNHDSLILLAKAIEHGGIDYHQKIAKCLIDATVYRVGNGIYKDAIAYLREANNLFPSAEGPEQIISLGRTALLGGDLEKSDKCFNIAFSACSECGAKIANIFSKEFDKKNDPALLKKALGYVSKSSAPDAISLQKNLFQKLKETTSLPELRKLVAKFGTNLPQAEQEEIAPPPTWQDVPGSVEIIDDPLLYTTEGAPITFPLAKVGHQAGFTGEHFEIKMYDPKTNKYIWWPCNNENFAKVIGDGIKKYPTYVRSITGKPVTKKLRVFK